MGQVLNWKNLFANACIDVTPPLLVCIRSHFDRPFDEILFSHIIKHSSQKTSFSEIMNTPRLLLSANRREELEETGGEDLGGRTGGQDMEDCKILQNLLNGDNWKVLENLIAGQWQREILFDTLIIYLIIGSENMARRGWNKNFLSRKKLKN